MIPTATDVDLREYCQCHMPRDMSILDLVGGPLLLASGLWVPEMKRKLKFSC